MHKRVVYIKNDQILVSSINTEVQQARLQKGGGGGGAAAPNPNWS
jgi:hypothetical protein